MNNKEQLDTLKDIKDIMQRSSRFISLSGLSGIFAGITALAGSYFAYQKISAFLANPGKHSIYDLNYLNLKINLLQIAFIVLMVAISGGIFFTYRQSKKKNLPIWDTTSKNLLINLFIPLVTGGLFLLALLFKYNNAFYIAVPSTLVFYGLALINASKYTYTDIRYLGFCEIILGLISIFFIGYGLYFWAFGFGILHIVYGTVMYFKYEK